MDMKSTTGNKLVAGTSIIGGVFLALFLFMESFDGATSLFLTTIGYEKPCNTTSQGLSHVYQLNPKYESEFEGKDKGFWNESEPELTCNTRLRKLLERDELRRRPTIREENPNQITGKVLPLFGKVFPDGLYFIAVGVGHPPKTYFLDIDTGSDHTWLTCDAPCVSCAKGPHPWYNPRSAEVVSCRDPICREVQIGQIQGCPSEEEGGGEGGSEQCDYDVHYGDGSVSQGVLVRDVLAFLHPEGRLLPARVVFGCAYDQEGPLSLSPSKTDGILGLGSSPISLPSQLSSEGIISNMIGHCISGGEKKGGFFFLGDQLVPPGILWTKMLGKPEAEYYFADLQGIKHGSEKLAVDPKVFSRENGGVIFDSGSSFTYLVEPAFKLFLEAVLENLRESGLQKDDSDPNLPNCWKGKTKFRSVEEASGFFESVELQFGGGRWPWSRASLSLLPEGYLLVNAAGNVCLGVHHSGTVLPGGATTIIGDISLRGYLVVYDNVHHRIGWIRQDCSQTP